MLEQRLADRHSVIFFISPVQNPNSVNTAVGDGIYKSEINDRISDTLLLHFHRLSDFGGMGNPRPVGKDTTVAIAVKKGSSSQAALKWTIDNLMTEGHSVTLVHVRHRAKAFGGKRSTRQAHMIEAFSGPDVRNGIDQGFKDILLMRAQEMLQPFQSYCQKKKIQSDVMILEDDDPVVALAGFVLAHQIDVMVIGTGSHNNGILTKLKWPDLATRVSKKVPYFCTVYIIAKGRLLSVRSSEPPTGSQLSDNASSGIVAVPHLEKESEFRSPLQNYRHSHISSGEFYGGSSSSYSDDSSFTRSYASSNSSNWDLSSVESSSFSDFGMDELQRLRLELIKNKKMYDSVCEEAPDAKMLSSALNLEENQGMENSQRSAYQAAAMTNITPRTEAQKYWRTNHKPPRPAFSTPP